MSIPILHNSRIRFILLAAMISLVCGYILFAHVPMTSFHGDESAWISFGFYHADLVATGNFSWYEWRGEWTGHAPPPIVPDFNIHAFILVFMKINWDRYYLPAVIADRIIVALGIWELFSRPGIFIYKIVRGEDSSLTARAEGAWPGSRNA
ncbi:MAG: hypothetical protein NTZ78_05160 [Candidatus Aureabacteria bacterium]|nr:hypothetical protein [Candidatus Auribacterota bacterium]